MDKRDKKILDKINKGQGTFGSSLFFNLFIIALGLFATFAGIAVFFGHIQNKPLSDSDLISVVGVLDSWEYKSTSRYSTDFIIKLKEYPSNFCVWSANLASFESSKFEATEKEGNKISLLILKNDIKNLSKQNNQIYVYSVSSPTNEYLTLSEYKADDNTNALLGLFMGIVFLLLLIGYFIFIKI